MRSIKVDDRTYWELLQLKRGCDTFDSVIRRALASHRARPGSASPVSDDDQAMSADQGA